MCVCACMCMCESVYLCVYIHIIIYIHYTIAKIDNFCLLAPILKKGTRGFYFLYTNSGLCQKQFSKLGAATKSVCYT